MSELDSLVFDEQGLIPAVVQDWRDGTVLMVGFMNREALDRTVVTRRVHFWSRSRNKLWEKGETSGHSLLLKTVLVDCDRDTVLVRVEPVGPTCHTGEPSCFFTRLVESGIPEKTKTAEAFGGILDHIYQTILDRKQSPRAGSYVTSLFEQGLDRMLKKVAEEASEVILASKNGRPEEIIHEVADLWFHTLVILGYHGILPQAVYQELAGRVGRSGISREGERMARGGNE